MPDWNVTSWIHACIHAWIHALIHAWMHAWIHAWIHAWMHAWIYTCIYAWIHACIHAWIQYWFYACMHAQMIGPRFQVLFFGGGWPPWGISQRNHFVTKAYWYLHAEGSAGCASFPYGLGGASPLLWVIHLILKIIEIIKYPKIKY